MSMADSFGKYEANHKRKVYATTWGHLFPEPESYHGSIRVANTTYDGVVVLQENIPGIYASPWWYDCIHEFVHSLTDDISPGQVLEYQVCVVVKSHSDNGDDYSTIEIEKKSRQYLMG